MYCKENPRDQAEIEGGADYQLRLYAVASALPQSRPLSLGVVWGCLFGGNVDLGGVVNGKDAS